MHESAGELCLYFSWMRGEDEDQQTSVGFYPPISGGWTPPGSAAGTPLWRAEFPASPGESSTETRSLLSFLLLYISSEMDQKATQRMKILLPF